MQSAHDSIVIRLTVTVVALTKIIEEGIEEYATFFAVSVIEKMKFEDDRREYKII